MNLFTKQTNALVLTGQLRLKDNQNPIEKINEHINYFKPDYTYLFLWDYEYELYGEQIKQIPNSEIIIADSNKYIPTEYEMQHLILQLRKYLLPSIKRRKDKFAKSEDIKAITNFMIVPSIKQQTFSQINFNHSNYIVSRYDIVYAERTNKLQLEEIYQFASNENEAIKKYAKKKVDISQQPKMFTNLEKKLYGLTMSLNMPYPLYAQYSAGQTMDYQLDAAIPNLKIGIEADGEIWHNNPDKIAKDKRRDSELAANGWIIVRFTDKEINDHPQDCLNVLIKAIKKRTGMSEGNSEYL